LTSQQYRDALAKLHLSQVQFAHLVGRDERTSRRWALDETDVPPEVEIILRAMLRGWLTVDMITKLRANSIRNDVRSRHD
jgi:hypothetical protein